MMRAAFVGLGDMGRGMAWNLAKADVELTVCNRSGSGLDEFRRAGIAATTELTDVAAAECIFFCLPDDSAVESCVERLLPQLSAGQTIVDCSTISYRTTVALAEKLAEKQVDFLDAPVSGQHAKAVDGTLTIMCGGEEAVFERMRPYLASMGREIVYMGKSGSGQLTKLINQLLYDINAAALAEILPFSVKMGLDSEKLGTVINHGTGRSYASEFFIPRDLDGKFSDGYPLRKAYKDLVCAAELGAREGIPLPVLGAATATYQMAMLRGWGDENKGAMLKLYEELLGVSFRKREA